MSQFDLVRLICDFVAWVQLNNALLQLSLHTHSEALL